MFNFLKAVAIAILLLSFLPMAHAKPEQQALYKAVEGEALGQYAGRLATATAKKIIEPVKNGKCSKYGYPKDKDCPKPKPKPEPKAKIKKPKKYSMPEETIRFVSSNIKVSNTAASFAKDWARIIRSSPDFIVLQEQASRTDDSYRVNNYEVFRSHANRIESSNPVVWDNARWEKIASGTRWLTHSKKNSLPNNHWGDRAVNYVTLKSRTTGRVISVISCHAAPTIASTEGLLPIFMSNLSKLVEELRQDGEVIFGGDFNMHFKGSKYFNARAEAYPFTNTFQSFGPLITHDGGGVIDYMYAATSSFLTPVKQGVWEQGSDHDAIWSEWTLNSKAPKIIKKRLVKLVLNPNPGQL